MPAGHLSEADVTIRPLTFVQICQAAGQLADARQRIAALTRRDSDAPAPPRVPLQALGLPFLYHLSTSGYGAFYGEQPVGWLFLRGWHQVLYVESLVVPAEWQQRGVEAILLAFAEGQARELQRRWVGLTALLGDAGQLEFYRASGFERGHWRIMRRERTPASAASPGAAVRLAPLLGQAALRAYRRFARQDVSAADAPDEVYLTRFLTRDPYRGPGRDWLVIHEGQPVAYLNRQQRAPHTALYLASGREWWGSPPLIDAVRAALDAPGSAAEAVELRLGSSGHHDAARAALEALGFTERPAAVAHMFKRVPGGAGQAATGNGRSPGG